MKIAILLSRVRVEEKLLMQAFEARHIAVEVIDDRNLVFEMHDKSHWQQYDVVVERCVTQSRALAALRIFNDWGIKTVNRHAVVQLCGDKLETSSVIIREGIASPRCKVAFTAEAALKAIEEMGYPVILKPATGSWGRLLSRINDRDAAETVLEHKEVLGSYQHSIFYIQEYIDKPARDIRSFVIAEENIGAIYRYSDHWVTNTARGARAENCPITPEIREISLAAAKAVGGGILAIDLLETRDGRLLVNEVNHTMEFRNSIATTGVNIPDKMIDYILQVARGEVA